MNRRSLLLILVITVLAAIAVPAFAQDRTVTPSFDRKASAKALATARAALKKARRAENNSESAKRTSATAKATAEEALIKASQVLDSVRVKQAVAKAEAETESEPPVQLSGGPSVTVTVPSSGLIEVWAQATVDGPGYATLFEDGQMMPGQAELCSPEPGLGTLFSAFGGPEPETVATPAANGVCATTGAPGPVLFQTAPGQHTYELRYGACGCAGEPVVFSNRSLRVAPRL